MEAFEGGTVERLLIHAQHVVHHIEHLMYYIYYAT